MIILSAFLEPTYTIPLTFSSGKLWNCPFSSIASSFRDRLRSRQRFRPARPNTQPSCGLLEDLTAGPSIPHGRARPLWKVVLLSLATGLLYYGFYKYCIEEELKAMTGRGVGGFLTVVPFTVGVLAPWYATSLGLAQEVGVWMFAAGFAWIAYWQWEFYRRLNSLYREAGMAEPICDTWIVVPGFNLIAGLRAIHFFSEYISRNERRLPDPLAAIFPFLSIPTLRISEFLTTPSLWLNLSSSVDHR